MDVKFKVRTRPNFKFYVLLLCYVNTREEVVPKKLILAPQLVHIPT